MHRLDKRQFINLYGFPAEWDAWALYPDELFEHQLQATAEDEAPHPDEHLRYGAFLWWLRTHRTLPERALIRLSHLAALDPDPCMSAAAIQDILFHPMANEVVANAVAEIAKNCPDWSVWYSVEDKQGLFGSLIKEGRMMWAERRSAHRIALDLLNPTMTESELRDLFAEGAPLALRGLVEHPGLPNDLLLSLSRLESGRLSRIIRSLASRRLAGRNVNPTDYAEKYSKDPWLWRRVK